MDPKPFTYKHFIQDVQSLKDDMLMYYIDEAVAISCRIKGKSVGPVLPEIKRAAIYASAFGQILRPDLEGYGRNYADILADIDHTTALYIRQLATEGKKAARQDRLGISCMHWARDCVNWSNVIFRVSIIQRRPSGIPDGNMISD